MDVEEILRRITQRKYRIIEIRLAKYNLVKGQAELLLLIKDNDGMTQNELANILGIKDSSMSVRLNKLEKNGYIVREIDDQNLKKKKMPRAFLNQWKIRICLYKQIFITICGTVLIKASFMQA